MQREWINKIMDEERGIVDIGPAPGRKNYPEPTSRWFQIEREEILKRDYKYYIQLEVK